MVLLRWALLFFVVSIIAAVLGFSGVAEGAADIAQLFFYLFLAICVLLVVLGVATYRSLT
jgi:uncharacterized membrane protein YtjA (UPF0391 family)